MTADTPGKRVYLVRLARGDGLKNPETLDDFAKQLSKVSAGRYDGSMVSRMENGERRVSIVEAEWIAELDPSRRGPAWVAFGLDMGAAMPAPDPARDRLLTEDEIERARRAVAKKAAARRTKDQKRRGA